MGVEVVEYIDRPLLSFGSSRVDLESIRVFLNSGPVYLVGLPWSGKSTVSRAALAGVSEEIVAVGHKIGWLRAGRYGVRGEVIRVGGSEARVSIVDLDPRPPLEVYATNLLFVLASLVSWVSRVVGAVDSIYRLFRGVSSSSEPWDRLRRALAARSFMEVVASAFDIASSIRVGFSLRQLYQFARSISNAVGVGRGNTYIIIDDSESLPPGKREAAITITHHLTGCSRTIVVYALPPRRVPGIPSGLRNDVGALEFLKSLGIPHCGQLEGLRDRIIFVPPDVALAAEVARRLAPAGDPEALARGSHGLPGLVAARARWNVLELEGSMVSQGLEDVVRSMVAGFLEADPLSILLAAGGPVWADTAALIAEDLARRMVEASRDPRFLSGLSPADKARFRLLVLRASKRLRDSVVYGEYAPEPRVVEAFSAGDGRLLLTYRREVGDFLETAVHEVVRLPARDPVGAAASAVISVAPEAMFSLTRSNPQPTYSQPA